MSEDVWSARDTTPDEIDDALRELLRQRHAANPALAPARVLNLVVVVDREWKGEISNRLQRVGRYHASRTVLCAVEPGRDTLDARVVMAYEEPAEGLGLIRERVEIDVGPEHLPHLDTIVDPVIVSALPTVAWCPHRHDQAVDAMLPNTDVVLLDSDDQYECANALERARELLRSAYVVDLAWLRTTPWRERIAASFDLPDRRPALKRIDRIVVRHHESSTASAMLLAGWFASRLHWEPLPLAPRNGAGRHGVARRGQTDIAIELTAVEQNTPGLAGVTISSEHGVSISLDRGPGGLLAKVRSDGSDETSWRVLGASRGEPGILGEGVRQALLRDHIYGPSLVAAQTLCSA